MLTRANYSLAVASRLVHRDTRVLLIKPSGKDVLSVSEQVDFPQILFRCKIEMHILVFFSLWISVHVSIPSRSISPLPLRHSRSRKVHARDCGRRGACCFMCVCGLVLICVRFSVNARNRRIPCGTDSFFPSSLSLL